MPPSRALVTGGAGFIGSHVSAALLAAGHEVVIIDDLSSGKRANIPEGARFEHLDIRSSDAAMVVREGRFDTLVHLAAQMDVRKSVADPVADASINIVGTLNLLEAVRAAAQRPRVVFSSTGGVLYGDFTTPPNVETFEKNPESPYAIAKLSVEYYLAYYARVHGLDTVALRFANVFGPRQDPHGEAGVVAIFCERILAGRPLTVFGDGEQTRDYVYIDDVVRAVQLAASAALPAPAKLDERGFNIGTATPTSVLQIAALLKRISDADVTVEFALKRAGEQARSFVSNEKAARLLGWTPKASLDAGLSATFRWFQSHS
jgi:UDP-glucose 4-epimerase